MPAEVFAPAAVLLAGAGPSVEAEATPRPRRLAAAQEGTGDPVDSIPLWVRVRSAVLLTAVAVVLGVATASAIGLAAVALFGLLRGAVG